jgi:predicted PurR-regulated permease PerM
VGGVDGPGGSPPGPADETAIEAALDDAEEARDEAEEARDEAEDARDEAVVADQDARDSARSARESEREARSDSEDPAFGRLGRPIRRDSPFMLGFLGALGVFVAYFLVQAVVNARSVIVLIVVALFLAIGLNPVTEWLVARGMRRGFAILIVFVGVIGAFVGFGFAVLPPVIEQTNALVKELPDLLSDLRKNPTIRQLDDDYGVIERAQAYVESGDLGTRLFGGIVGVGRIVLNAVFSAFSLLIMTLYFLAALPSMKRQAYRLVPATRRERVTLLSDEVISRIGGFISGALTVAFIAGVTSYVFLLVVGLPYALALAVFVALFDLIPLVGATIAAVVVSLLGFTQSVTVGIVCVAFYVGYQQFENYVVYPRVMRRAVDVPAPVTVVAVLLGGALLGVVGALLAIPIAAAVLLVLRQVAIPRMDRT